MPRANFAFKAAWSEQKPETPDVNWLADHEPASMIRRQKALLKEIITVAALTAIVVAAMTNLKHWVHRSDAMQAMEQLGRRVLKYREDNGSLPSESYVFGIKRESGAGARLDNLRYRALWVDLETTPDEILAYAEKNYPSSLLSDGYVVLRLDGRVEWMGKRQFEELLARQQSTVEIETMRN